MLQAHPSGAAQKEVGWVVKGGYGVVRPEGVTITRICVTRPGRMKLLAGRSAFLQLDKDNPCTDFCPSGRRLPSNTLIECACDGPDCFSGQDAVESCTIIGFADHIPGQPEPTRAPPRHLLKDPSARKLAIQSLRNAKPVSISIFRRDGEEVLRLVSEIKLLLGEAGIQARTTLTSEFEDFEASNWWPQLASYVVFVQGGSPDKRSGVAEALALLGLSVSEWPMPMDRLDEVRIYVPRL